MIYDCSSIWGWVIWTLRKMLPMMILFPNSRALLPIFQTNSPDGSHFTQMGSLFAQNTIPTPVLYSAVTHSFGGYYTKHPQPHPKFGPKTPLILAWTWGWIKWNTIWAIRTPTGQNVWKVSKTFLEFIFLCSKSAIYCGVMSWGGDEVGWYQVIQYIRMNAMWDGLLYNSHHV